MMKHLDELKQDFLSKDPDVSLAAIDALAEIGGEEVFDFVIPYVNDPNEWLRMNAGMVLQDVVDQRALEPLVRAIKNPEFVANKGTLVFALAELDCSDLFILLVELALSNNFEVQSHALSILDEQTFNVTLGDVVVAEKMMADYGLGPDKGQDYEVLLENLEDIIEEIKDNI